MAIPSIIGRYLPLFPSGSLNVTTIIKFTTHTLNFVGFMIWFWVLRRWKERRSKKGKDTQRSVIYPTVSSSDWAFIHLWYHILAKVGSLDPVRCHLLGSMSHSTSKHFPLFCGKEFHFWLAWPVWSQLLSRDSNECRKIYFNVRGEKWTYSTALE